MSVPRDHELDDVLQDPELLRLAERLGSVRLAEPPLDDAFRSALRRQLMQKAWEMTEGRLSWWRRLAAPPSLAWAGAAVGVVLIAGVVVYMSTQQPGGLNEVVITSPIQGGQAVALQQPILVRFNQPMDHASTEAAVQIQPATSVVYSWSANDLSVLPIAGDLAPNTQYQVTIGPGAKTAGGTEIAAAQKITFVTQPVPTLAPTPTPNATPKSLLTGIKQLVPFNASRPNPIVWSADSSTLFVVGANGELDSVLVNTGAVKVLVAGGVSAPAVAPAGDRIAYLRGASIEVLTLASGAFVDFDPGRTTTTLVGWAKDTLIWGGPDGIYDEGAQGPERLAAPPADPAITLRSIAPDGTHAIFDESGALVVVDITTGKSSALSSFGAGTAFYGWAPNGSRLVYGGINGSVVAATDGSTIASLPPGQATWSSSNEVLLGTDIDLYEVRPDSTGLTKLADGTFNGPEWAPDGSTLAFERGGSVWIATAPTPPTAPGPLDEAGIVVNAFMQARLAGNADRAGTFLDGSGKAAYGSGGQSLIPGEDAHITRFYVLMNELDGSSPNSVRVVVRLVGTHDKIDDSQVEESLTLQRRQSTDPLLIHAVTTTPRRDLGKSPEVVAVDASAGQVAVTFDSDLKPDAAATGVIVRNGQGQQVGATVSYGHRTVTLAGLQLSPGAPYTLVVLPALQDVSGRHMAAEYDLAFAGPGSLGLPSTTPSPSPSPSPPGPATSPPSSPTPATPTPTAKPPG